MKATKGDVVTSTRYSITGVFIKVGFTFQADLSEGNICHGYHSVGLRCQSRSMLSAQWSEGWKVCMRHPCGALTQLNRLKILSQTYHIFEKYQWQSSICYYTIKWTQRMVKSSPNVSHCESESTIFFPSSVKSSTQRMQISANAIGSLTLYNFSFVSEWF